MSRGKGRVHVNTAKVSTYPGAPNFSAKAPVGSPPGLNLSAAGQGYPCSSRSLPATSTDVVCRATTVLHWNRIYSFSRPVRAHRTAVVAALWFLSCPRSKFHYTTERTGPFSRGLYIYLFCHPLHPLTADRTSPIHFQSWIVPCHITSPVNIYNLPGVIRSFSFMIAFTQCT